MKLYRVFLNIDACNEHDGLSSNPIITALCANDFKYLVGVTNNKQYIKKFKNTRNNDMYIYDIVCINETEYSQLYSTDYELMEVPIYYNCDKIWIISNLCECDILFKYIESLKDYMFSEIVMNAPYEVLLPKYKNALEQLRYTLCQQLMFSTDPALSVLYDQIFDVFQIFIHIFTPFMAGFNT